MRVVHIMLLVSMTPLGSLCQQSYANYYLPSEEVTVGYAVGNALPWQQLPARYNQAPHQVLLQRPDYTGTGYVAAYVGQSLAYLKRKRA